MNEEVRLRRESVRLAAERIWDHLSVCEAELPKASDVGPGGLVGAERRELADHLKFVKRIVANLAREYATAPADDGT